MRKKPRGLALACALLVAPPVLAQHGMTPAHEAVTQPQSDKPMTVAPTPAAPVAPDEELDRLVEFLTGTFVSEAATNSPALVVHVAPAKIEGLSRAIIVEIARADAAGDPFRIYFLRPYRRQGAIRLRTLEFPGASGLDHAVAGFWAAPELLSTIDASSVAPSMDMAVVLNKDTGKPTTYRAQTEHPFPTNRSGAIEMTAMLRATPVDLVLGDAGFDEKGERVWGAATDSGTLFRRIEEQPLVRRDATGVIVITTVKAPANAPKHEPGGEVAIQYTTWLSTGQRLHTSREGGEQPAKVRIPGSVLPGLNIGLDGIAKGERRKIILPPAQAYGERGQGFVPPKSTIIVDAECIYVDNASAGAPAAPAAAPMNPHAPRSTNPPPAPAPEGQPVGQPPTNGTPETPR